MYDDDWKALLAATQNPLREAVRQMEDLDGSAQFRRVALEAMQGPRYALDLDLPDLEADTAGLGRSIARELLDGAAVAGAAALVETSIRAPLLESLAAELAQPGYQELVKVNAAQALALPEDWRQAAARLVDRRAITREMTEHCGAIYPGYESLLRSIGDSLSTAKSRPLGEDVFELIQRDFDKLQQASRLLEPLQTLSQAWASAFGDALTVGMLKNQLAQPFGNLIDSAWADPYQHFARLVDDARGNLADDDSSEIGEVAEQNPLDSEVGIPVAPAEHNVWTVATRIAVSYHTLTVRLTAVASRMDADALGGTAKWERMLLAIGHASPAHAHELLALAYPLLQCFSLLFAPAGSMVHGSSESHQHADIERFETLVEEVLQLLDRIERALGP